MFEPWQWAWANLSGWALVTARVLGLCLTAPGLALPGVAWRFKLLLAAFLGSVLAPVLGSSVGLAANGTGAAWAILGEMLAGGLLGMAAGLIIAAARGAGDLVAAQAGLSTATLFDPESGEELTPLGRLYGLVAMSAFLMLDGPLALVRALAESYEAIPAGRLLVSRELTLSAFGQVGQALELSLRAAAPPALAMIMAGLALTWLSRTAPSLPFLVLALPIRSIVGIILTLIGLASLALLLGNAWQSLPGFR